MAQATEERVTAYQIPNTACQPEESITGIRKNGMGTVFAKRTLDIFASAMALLVLSRFF